MHTQRWIDSSGAGRHLSNLLTTTRPTGKYPHDPDIILHFKWLWAQTQTPQIMHKISWVRGHQDSTLAFIDLPRNAQLHILADDLATAFARNQLTSKFPSWRTSLFFRASGISLIINGQRNTASLKEAMRFHINRNKNATIFAAITTSVDQDGMEYDRLSGHRDGFPRSPYGPKAQDLQSNSRLVTHRP